MEAKKFVVVFLTLALVLGVCQGFEYHEKEMESEEGLWSMYMRWMSHHNVSRRLDEMQKRFIVFKANVEHVHNTNKLDKPYKLELNKFADMSNDEFQSLCGGNDINHHPMFQGNSTFMYENVRDVPKSVDWRKKGVVTPEKNQGTYGSCWAFSAVVAVEGINYIKTKKLISLSEQELVDCDTQNSGCGGGFKDEAFDFIKKNGLATEAKYPYKYEAGNCDVSAVSSPAVSIDGHEFVPAYNEKALLKAVANQPISVAIDAEGLRMYSKGVFTERCGTNLNHEVTVVGYGTTLFGIRTKYWIVKNSCGTNWGEEGYIRMKRDVSAKEGICGIAVNPSYPIKTS